MERLMFAGRSGGLAQALPASGKQLVRSRTGATLGRMGALEVRLAGTRQDVRRAQKLRYRVFYKRRHRDRRRRHHAGAAR